MSSEYRPQHSPKGDRDYLLRSEKRNNSAYMRARRRQRVSRILTVTGFTLSLVIWPVGMILLWLKKVRLYPSTKLLLSMISLILCILLCGTLLNAPFRNENLSRAQDSVNTFLDSAYDAALRVIDRCVDSTDGVSQRALDLGSSMAGVVAVHAADAIDTSLDVAQAAREGAEELYRSIFDGDSPASPTAAPTSEPTQAPLALTTPAPVSVPTPARQDYVE